MKSSGLIGAIRTDHEPPEWEEFASSLWTSPSSPPYPAAPSRNPFSSPNLHASHHSTSSSALSDFEFDPVLNAEVGDIESPVSPKFLFSSATEYWAAPSSTASAQISSLRVGVSSLDVATTSASDHPHDAPTLVQSNRSTPPRSPSRKQPSTPSSSSVRQLITQEMRGEQHDSDSYVDFYSVPQTPAPPRSRPPIPKQRALSISYEPPHHKKQTGPVDYSIDVRQKSKSAVLDRREVAFHSEHAAGMATEIGGRQLKPSKSASHSHFSAVTASANPQLNTSWDKSSEEEKNNAMAKKAGSSKSFRKWAFKDLLRRTVPSSKADAHYITKTLGAPTSSKSSAGILASPQASPPRSQAQLYPNNSTFKSTHDGRPYPHAPQSRPPHWPSSTTPRSPTHVFDTHSEPPTPRFPSTPGQTPTPSPPRSPLSSHAIHYKLQKAQSQELGKKTFLPYRQSLLGCLGGSGAFSPDRLVW